MGLQLGLLLVLFIAGAGVGSLLLASEVAFNIVKTVGALYLIYLGLAQWRAKVKEGTEVEVAARAVAPSVKRRLLTGFLTNATNPKGIIFMVAVLPQFIDPARGAVGAQALSLGVVFVALAIVVNCLCAILASTLGGWLRSYRAPAQAIERFIGGFLTEPKPSVWFESPRFHTTASYGRARGKVVCGLRTDFRLAGDNIGAIVNLQVQYFIEASGGAVVTTVEELVGLARRLENDDLRRA